MKHFYVYIIKSDQGYYYIGNTSNLTDRLHRHNTNRSTYTSNKGQWEYVVFKECSSKTDAVNLELKLKNFKSSSKAIFYLINLS